MSASVGSDAHQGIEGLSQFWLLVYGSFSGGRLQLKQSHQQAGRIATPHQL